MYAVISYIEDYKTFDTIEEAEKSITDGRDYYHDYVIGIVEVEKVYSIKVVKSHELKELTQEEFKKISQEGGESSYVHSLEVEDTTAH